MPARLSKNTRSVLLHSPGWALILAGLCLTLPATSADCAEAASAKPVTPAASAAPQRSKLDAPLFYQLLIGEIELRNGEPGTAYQVLMDAARRTREPALYQRATNIAIQARAGEQALQATDAWRKALPKDIEAIQMQAQLHVLLNRPTELAGSLRELIELSPTLDQAGLINSVPRLVARMPEPSKVQAALEPWLRSYFDKPATDMSARVAVARLSLASGEHAKAFEMAKSYIERDPKSELAAGLALDLLPTHPEAESLLQDHLRAAPDDLGMRLAYARWLTRAQRYGEAVTEFSAITQNPQAPAAVWLSLGALQLELHQQAQAQANLQQFLKLTDTATPGNVLPNADNNTQVDTNDDSRQQAWLMLAQIAEQQGNFAAAEGWLAKIGSSEQTMEVQYRRASVLAHQGRVQAARELLRSTPEKTPDDAKAKVIAEAQLLRDLKQWKLAHEVLAAGNQRFEGSIEMLYEQAMMAEKIGKMDELEKLLRRVIELKPDHYHAYNALGYSLAERGQRLPEAKVLIEKALSHMPGDPFITDSLGWVEFRLGHNQSAITLLKRAYQARPDTEIAAHLGEVLWSSGQKDEAKRIWREGAKRDKDNEALQETLKRLKVKL